MSLINNRIQGWKIIDMMISMTTASLAFWALFACLTVVRGRVPVMESYYVLWGLSLAGIGLHCLSQARRRRTALGLAMSENLYWISGQVIAVALCVFAGMVFLKDSAVSRVFLVLFLVILPVALVAGRKSAVKWLAPHLFDRRHQCGALIVGSMRDSAHLVEWLRSKKAYGLKLLGYVADEAKEEVNGVALLGETRDLDRIMSQHRPDVVIAAGFEHLGQNWDRLRGLCERRGARLAFSLGAGVDLAGGLTCYQEDGVNLLALRNEPLESPVNRTIKRTLDIAIALPVVVLVLPPLALAVWLLQRMVSPGPLLFRQQRSGLRGVPFTMLKFRTMHLDNPDEAKQAVARDPRVYRGGGWLRRLSLDEFPQFINVLLGHMSVVGPRPHFVAHDEWFSEMSHAYRVRMLIKPGITGLAQVKGYRGPTSTAEHVECRTREDIYYLENWSLFMDCFIIFRTAFQFLLGARNAI